ncbi:MAG TPA: LLM class flavin-dependent oxidoreductase [Candidatus Binatia bacterium]|nr:LLM class flavin-dependent oxidoreductase [Candidatus Binatia bacterium]
MAISFGISFAPNHPRELSDWCRASEDAGFERAGVVDSQSIYRELYVSCAAAVQATTAIQIGPRVTNALTRHPSVTASALLTLNESAPGRVFAGFGTGDSAVFNIGLKPVKLAVLGEFTTCIRALMRGEAVQYQGSEIKLTWGKADIPIYIAGHGPKTLELAGQYADGVIVGTGVGDDVVRDAYLSIAAGAARAGRRAEDLDVWWALSAYVGNSREEALSIIRMLLAAKANHLARFPEQNKHVPPEHRELLEQIHKGYNYLEHQKPGAGTTNAALVRQSGLESYLADRYAIVGRPDQCLATLRKIASYGVRKVWLNVHFDDKIGFIKRWSREVMVKTK